MAAKKGVYVSDTKLKRHCVWTFRATGGLGSDTVCRPSRDHSKNCGDHYDYEHFVQAVLLRYAHTL